MDDETRARDQAEARTRGWLLASLRIYRAMLTFFLLLLLHELQFRPTPVEDLIGSPRYQEGFCCGTTKGFIKVALRTEGKKDRVSYAETRFLIRTGRRRERWRIHGHYLSPEVWVVHTEDLVGS